MILALDTSTSIASVAIYDGTVSSEITWHAGRNHSVELLAQASNLLHLSRLEPSQISVIAVATGPGSYTGLRVGLAAAKGLCMALQLPIIGVCSLDVLAEPHRGATWPVRPVLEAGRGRYATALYRIQGGQFQRTSAIEGRRLPEILADIEEDTILCGDLGLLWSGTEVDRAQVHVATPAASLRRSGYLAEIAWRLRQSGQTQDPNEVEALYLGREE